MIRYGLNGKGCIAEISLCAPASSCLDYEPVIFIGSAEPDEKRNLGDSLCPA